MSSMFRSTNRASTASSASSNPELVTTNCVSRRCPGPSPTMTSAAPSRRSATTAAATRRGSVLIAVSSSNSTRLGFSTTRAPADVGADRAEPLADDAVQAGVVARRAEHGDARRYPAGRTPPASHGCAPADAARSGRRRRPRLPRRPRRPRTRQERAPVHRGHRAPPPGVRAGAGRDRRPRERDDVVHERPSGRRRRTPRVRTHGRRRPRGDGARPWPAPPSTRRRVPRATTGGAPRDRAAPTRGRRVGAPRARRRSSARTARGPPRAPRGSRSSSHRRRFRGRASMPTPSSMAFAPGRSNRSASTARAVGSTHPNVDSVQAQPWNAASNGTSAVDRASGANAASTMIEGSLAAVPGAEPDRRERRGRVVDDDPGVERHGAVVGLMLAEPRPPSLVVERDRGQGGRFGLGGQADARPEAAVGVLRLAHARGKDRPVPPHGSGIGTRRAEPVRGADRPLRTVFRRPDRAPVPTSPGARTPRLPGSDRAPSGVRRGRRGPHRPRARAGSPGAS